MNLTEAREKFLGKTVSCNWENIRAHKNATFPHPTENLVVKDVYINYADEILVKFTDKIFVPVSVDRITITPQIIAKFSEIG